MNNIVNSGLKDGWEVEEVNGKKVLSIFAHGERVQMHDLAEFSNSLRAELETSADRRENKSINQTRVMEDFAYFLHNIDFSNLQYDDGDLYQFDDPIVRQTIDSMISDRFLLIVKPRQVYMSTLLDTYALWRAAFHNDNVMIITYDSESAQRHIAKINKISCLKGAFEMLKDFDATTGKKDCITFPNGGRIKSKAANPMTTKGESLDLLIFDEPAFFKPKDLEEMWKVAHTRIGMNRGQCIMASTPYKREGLFHELYNKTKLETTNPELLNYNEGLNIVDSCVVRKYKFRKDHLILKFTVPAVKDIDSYQVVCADDVYYGDQKVINKYELLNIHEKYRGKMEAGSNTIDLLVSVKLDSIVRDSDSVNIGYEFDGSKFGIEFILIEKSIYQSDFKVIEIPFASIKSTVDRTILPPREKTGNDAIDAADMIHDIMSGEEINSQGYKRLKNGKLLISPSRMNPIFSSDMEIHCEMDCKFIPKELTKGKDKIVNVRMGGDMLDKVEERINEISILTQKESNLSDYIRGLIQKDLN